MSFPEHLTYIFYSRPNMKVIETRSGYVMARGYIECNLTMNKWGGTIVIGMSNSADKHDSTMVATLYDIKLVNNQVDLVPHNSKGYTWDSEKEAE